MTTPTQDEPEDIDSPATRPSRRRLAMIVIPLGVVIVSSIIGNAIHPSLLNHHPLLLVFLEPRTRYLLLVADRGVAFVPFLVVATVRRLLTDPLYYLLGTWYGAAGIRWIEHRLGEGGAAIGLIQKWFGKAAPAFVLLLPGPLVCALAGSTGMNAVTFFALNIVGTVAVVFITYHFASLVSGPLDAINGFYAEYGKWLTALSVTITFLWILSKTRGGKGYQSLDEIERELQEDES